MTNRKLTRTEAKSIAEQLKRAIADSELSNYEVWKRTGVDQATLGRFLSGERTITLDTADKLCDGLGIAVRISRRK